MASTPSPHRPTPDPVPHAVPEQRSALDQGPDRAGALERFIGGSPLGVALRLIIVSIAVGLVMSALGLDAPALIAGLLGWLSDLARTLQFAGTDIVRSLWHWLALGAVIVVPIWLIRRLLRLRRER